MNGAPYDVTVSVWNEFYAPELCSGLVRAGNRVLALRSEHAEYPGVSSKTCHAAMVLTRAFHKLHAPFILEASQDAFENFARRRVGQSSVFWGWNGHNLSAFRAARKAGQRVLCERGSTHGAWAARRLARVHRDLGWGPATGALSPREEKGIAEYEVAEKILVPSKFVLRTFLEEGVPEHKLHINPYGVDQKIWHAVEGAARAKGAMVFIYTASIIPRKGAHVLLRAWEKAALKDAELWMIGGVHFPLKQVHLPTGHNVKFLGYQQPRDLARLYDRASVYVLPSFEEGMARSGIEALAAGLPAIVTEETGLTDLAKSGKEMWVIPSGDVDRLADTLRAAYAERGQLAERSRDARACTENASKKAYGDRAAEFLRQFIGEGPARA